METVYFVLPKQDSGKNVSLVGVTPPTSPTYLYTYAKSLDFGSYTSGRCIDLSIHNQNHVLDNIEEGDLVCLTTTISNYNGVINLARKSKAKGAKTALGGPWATVKTNQIANHQPFVDYIIQGEGESALEEILLNITDEKIIKRKNHPICQLPKIDFSGWTKEDLQEYQEKYKQMLETGVYGEVPEEIPFFVFYQSSRGCTQKPRCGFCGSRLGNKYITRTDKQFYEDIEKIVEQISPINKRIHVFDCSDSFTTGLDRFEEYKSLSGVTFTVFARADEITPYRAEALRKLGVTKVSIGIETGSNEAMKTIGKKVNTDQNIRAVEILKDNGISTYVNLLYGCPNETSEQLGRTVDHFAEISKKGDIYRVAGRIVTVLPKSRWYFQLLKRIKDKDKSLGNSIDNNDKIDTNYIQELWLKEMTNLTLEDIEKAHGRLVSIAKQENISLSSEYPKGLV